MNQVSMLDLFLRRVIVQIRRWCCMDHDCRVIQPVESLIQCWRLVPLIENLL